MNPASTWRISAALPSLATITARWSSRANARAWAAARGRLLTAGPTLTGGTDPVADGFSRCRCLLPEQRHLPRTRRHGRYSVAPAGSGKSLRRVLSHIVGSCAHRHR
jgi:hypothetical protein